MLLKRLEVTLDSFLGEDKNEKLKTSKSEESNDQIRQAIQNQREYLEHIPKRYTVS